MPGAWMQFYSIDRYVEAERGPDPILIDSQGQPRSVDEVRGLSRLAAIARSFEHEGVVLVDKGNVIYLNCAQTDWIIETFLADRPIGQLGDLPATERAKHAAQAWQTAREWYSYSELSMRLASIGQN